MSRVRIRVAKMTGLFVDETMTWSRSGPLQFLTKYWRKRFPAIFVTVESSQPLIETKVESRDTAFQPTETRPSPE